MQVLNLAHPDNGTIKYSITRFPDGEVQITLGDFSRKDTVTVKCRITNAEELFILMQVADILNRHSVIWDLEIYYLMTMRMDRVMDFNRPFSLKIVGDIIKNLGARSREVFEPHSEATYSLLRSYESLGIYSDEYKSFHPDCLQVQDRYTIIYPDAGAARRYKYSSLTEVMAEKVRDVETGKITSIKITNPELLTTSKDPLIVIDDLCDNGGTFLGLMAEIRKYTDKPVDIFVTHMVNPNGITNLSSVYNHVYFTNSYKDWTNLPDNVTLIKVL